MRITAISDTHNKHNQLTLPGGELLIHAGDFTSIGRKHEVEKFIEWLDKQPYDKKIFIAGNHDISFQSEKLQQAKSAHFDRKVYDVPGADGKPEWLETMLENLPKGVIYLENEWVKYEYINIWGSPYSPEFGYGWAFNYKRGNQATKIWNEIPIKADIVVTHTPIYGYNDRTANTNQNVGCEELYHRLRTDEIEPHIHICGHIHEAYGYKEIPYRRNWGQIYTFNAASCNLQYECINPPITFDYDFETRELNFV